MGQVNEGKIGPSKMHL